MGKDKNDPHLKKSIDYVENHYTTFENGKYVAWEARWGLNYLYTSGALIPGLARIGYDLTNTLIAKNMLWIKDR